MATDVYGMFSGFADSLRQREIDARNKQLFDLQLEKLKREQQQEREASELFGRAAGQMVGGGASSGYGSAPGIGGARSPSVDSRQLPGLPMVDGGGRPLNPAGAQAAGQSPGYLDRLVQAESGGNPNARPIDPATGALRSSAQGPAQFTDATWAGMAKNRPDLGLTPDGRTNPQQSNAAAGALAQENATILRRAGLPANDATLYAMHFLGAPTAPRVLTAPDETPMAQLVPRSFIAANPQLAQQTAGQFRQWAGSRISGGRAQPGSGEAPEAASTTRSASIATPSSRWPAIRGPGSSSPRSSRKPARAGSRPRRHASTCSPSKTGSTVPIRTGSGRRLAPAATTARPIRRISRPRAAPASAAASSTSSAPRRRRGGTRTRPT